MAIRILCALLMLFLSSPSWAATPKLIVQITVDQLRGDLLPRLQERFGKGGFRRLMDQGVYFTNAHYGTANTFTASGHAVLVTGADTAEHGMVANEWFDRASGQLMHSTADSNSPIVGEPPKPGAGMSPRNLSSTTIGDEIVTASAGQSRAFAVAGKDRSAIIPGGHRGKAFWFSESSGGFISSAYYGPELPPWVAAWNARSLAAQYKGRPWTPLYDATGYLFTGQPGNPHARPQAVLGRDFPHAPDGETQKAFLSALRYTPYLDDLTATFARELIDAERLGQGPHTDYLAISFSGNDYIGHAFGPNSLEYEDSLLRLDLVLAKFLASLDKTVGRDGVLIVLSADHGVDDIPEERHALGHDADRIRPEQIRQRANAALKNALGVSEDLVQAFVPPGFYLDATRITAVKRDKAEVAAALAAHLVTEPGIAYAFTRDDILTGRVPATAMGTKVSRAFHPRRSGDVVIVQEQYWYMYPDADAFAAMHGSPYSYDTFVPVIFAGAGLKPAAITRTVDPAQIAPTLAAILRIRPPSGSNKEPLAEALPNPRQ